jgi:hypothetical protein
MIQPIMKDILFLGQKIRSRDKSRFFSRAGLARYIVRQR